ncbi:MAG: SDR family NAD(P)-dependent oxidoreductase [Candidatus Pelagibacter sp.]|jgi:NAD(P)-dependent dehydrogenase (short-subunit alcohol dehydrogenase family)|nr:SDR family oxidoreductase [Pseudomonadota bacterium]NCX65027.1 SDR family oxidoreductase [Pseudomonadota bacterium]
MKVTYSDLKNKKVFITGGGSGIGASIVEHFCEQNSDVYFVDINIKDSNKLINKLKKKKFRLPKFIECDLLDVAKLQNVIRNIITAKGPINVLVNNAANDQRHKTEDVDEKYWENRIGVNLKHCFFAAQAVVEGMKKLKNGSIVNLGSVSWMLGEGDKVIYETAKSAVVGLTRSFAQEFGTFNIRCNSVVPGSIATERQIKHWLTPKYKKLILEKQALKRQLKPEDVARLVLFLASDQSSGCTKQDFIVDAGIT